MRLFFTKMQGIGNDFIVIDDYTTKKSTHLTPELAKKICDRRFGVGADQILWIKPAQSAKADARMEILNADGSIAEMCGNGIRAVALYLNRYSADKKTTFQIETLAGVLPVSLLGNQVRVGMGIPKLNANHEQTLELDGRLHKYFDIEVGVPHAVFFAEDVSKVPLEDWGARIELHSNFPNKTNVDFYEVLTPHKIRLRVWERGAGVTLACGTGACSTAVAAILSGRAKSPLEVELPGGVLQIEWEGKGKPVIMTGPAVEVFKGEWSD